ncbi:MAG: sigma-54-dependent Fis family transcriptional regulator [Proteobacteria bacterium]|nr:sigma-54-dependent Fis family transcriptional regulator [Pseudomonadota bacterium]MBU4372127.1 sigma-54-dependent Fis family transcriptional regulator [Pseudomonadota bacterium]MBU4583443.1 sigma-54-dependent Fis family transcriptional regulator [Pseudomonadota bacterium]MCG2739166.1 sigma-54-dependent Fis family transcriptional regulator [Syntrophaceae bacterium]
MMQNARSLLVRDGAVPSRFFTPEIRASWKRCFDIGLDPFGESKPAHISTAELSKLRDENDLVRRLAKIEMGNLHRQIAGSNFIIIFADSNGIILDSIEVDGYRAINNASRTSPGHIWKEETNGTNALGLVSATQQPSIVHGDEHFFKAYTGLTCAAAPIFGHFGKMVGIIDATSDCQSRQRHTLALVGMSCITIENGLFRDRHKDTLILEIHNRREFLGTLQSGMLAFDENGFLKEPNRQAQFFLQGIPLKPQTHFDEIFRTSFKHFIDQMPGGRSVHLTDMEGSSFEVWAFNHHARKLNVKHSTACSVHKATSETHMVHKDPAVKEAMHMVKRAVQLNVPILIRGETGTGKELMARYAHSVSGRKGDFVPVNCAALPETLIESELFGHQEGAFTGTSRGGSKGIVQQAQKGTLFLDEIGAMPTQLQVKLLRFLDRMEIRPVGKTTEIQLDIQLISATNAKLTGPDKAIEFRTDLLYRINTMEVCLPPLRERKDLHAIIEVIAEAFQHTLEIEPEALSLLERYNWPGNIRELKNLLIRLFISCQGGTVRAEDVRKLLSTPLAEFPGEQLPKNLAEHEREIILAAFDRHHGNISAVARDLGISRNKIYKKLKAARTAS